MFCEIIIKLVNENKGEVMKKRILSSLLALGLAVSLTACGQGGASSANSKFKAGTYEGKGNGFGGEITATVVLSDSKIESITVVGDKETQGIGSVAVEQLPGKMVEAQAVEIDGISGASYSSKGIKEAVTDALSKAGVDASKLVPVEKTEKAEAKEETIEADVVVVGAGGAGLTAAIEAKQAGMNVVIVEKAAYAGGNTSRATGGMNAAETKLQAELGINDTVETFIKDTMEGGYNKNNIELVTKMCEESSDAIDWLASIGAPLEELSFSGGATYKRIHRPAGGAGVGAYLVEKFVQKAEELQIPVYYNTEVKSIIMDGDKAAGVMASSEDTNYTINAKSVIVATGGFGANEELYTKYRPELKGYVTTNVPTANGDGITMATEVGANTVDMEQIQIHPTVEQGTAMLITESVRGDGAILVNQSGVRFGDELRTRDVVSASINEQEGSYAYLVFDQQLRDGLSAVEKYVKGGFVEEADSVEALAEKIGMDSATLAETVAKWNETISTGKDNEFGRNTGMEHDITKAPFYAIKIAPGVHHTMGGIEINTDAQVISKQGAPISGLFAAGEVVGGVHGGNRIGGTAVTDIVVYGRIAGKNAANYVASL